MKEFEKTEEVLPIFVGKWKPIIIYHLTKDGKKRYSELQRLIPDITKRMLTLKLRELEKDQIITRKVYNQVPPKVEYSITDYGKSLDPLLNKMSQWGTAHVYASKKPMSQTKDNPDNVCQALTTIDTIIGKWKSVVLSELFSEALRFNELQKKIPQISRTMLTSHLRDLEAEGIIQREVYNQVPPKVVYLVTNYGKSLEVILSDIHSWAQKHMLQLEVPLEQAQIGGRVH